jgi:hypothetical protein
MYEIQHSRKRRRDVEEDPFNVQKNYEFLNFVPKKEHTFQISLKVVKPTTKTA